MNNIIGQLTKMKTGDDLISSLTVLPRYDENIRYEDRTARLITLSEIYNIYIPSDMSVEI